MSPRSYDLSLQADGTYTFRVRATDAAGNTGAEATRSYNLDRTAPAAPTITSAPAGELQDDTPTYAWTGEIGSSSRVPDRARRDRRRRLGGVLDAAHLRRHGRGRRRLHLPRPRRPTPRATPAPTAPRTYTLDRTPPAAPTIVAQPPAATNDDTPDLRLDRRGRLDRRSAGSSAGRPSSATGRPARARARSTSRGEPDGTYTFLRARHRRRGQHRRPTRRARYTLDRAAPAAPAITTRPDRRLGRQNADVALHRRGRRDVPRAGSSAARRSSATGRRAPSPRTLRPLARGRRHLHVPRPRDRSRRATRAPSRHALLHARPHRAGGADDHRRPDGRAAGRHADLRVDRRGRVVARECRDRARRDRGRRLGGLLEPEHASTSRGEVDGGYTFRVRVDRRRGQHRAPTARRSYTLDRTAPVAPTDRLRPGDRLDRRHPDLRLHRRGRRDARVPPRARRDRRRRLGAVHEPEDLRRQRRARRHLHVPRPRHRRGRQHRRRRDARPTRSTARSRSRRRSTRGRATTATTRTPEWAFSTTEANRTFECRLARGADRRRRLGPLRRARSGLLARARARRAYTFAVRAVNLAGTRSPATTDLYRLDTAAPAAPGVSGGPAADSSDDTPTWTISPEPGATLECRLERGATVVSDWAACSTPAGFDLRREVDGTYTFLTRATDAAGNTGAPGSDVLHARPHGAAGAGRRASTPPPAGSDATPTWEFDGRAGQDLRVPHRRAAADRRRATGRRARARTRQDLSGEPDGDYTFEIRAVNPAGTRGPTASDDYELDRATPAAPVITGGPAADSPDDTPTWTFTGEPQASLRVPRRARRRRSSSTGPPAPAPTRRTSTPEPDGTYTFRVRQTDPAGNIGPDASRSYNLDRTIPVAPVDRRRGPASPGSDQTPTWTFTGDGGPDVRVPPDARRRRRLGLGGLHHPARLRSRLASPTAPTPSRSASTTRPATRSVEVDRRLRPRRGRRRPRRSITGAPGPLGNGSEPAVVVHGRGRRDDGVPARARGGRRATVGAVHQRRARTASPASPTATTRSRSARPTPPATPARRRRTTTRSTASPPAPPSIDGAQGPLGRGRHARRGRSPPRAARRSSARSSARGGAGRADWAVCASPRRLRPHRPRRRQLRASASARVDAAGNASPVGSGRTCSTRRRARCRSTSGPAPLGRDRAPGVGASPARRARASSAACRCATSPVADWGPCVSPRGFDLDGAARRRLRLRAARDRPGRQRRPGRRRALRARHDAARRAVDRPPRPSRRASDAHADAGASPARRDATFACRVERAGDAPSSTGRCARARSPPTSRAPATATTASSSARPTSPATPAAAAGATSYAPRSRAKDDAEPRAEGRARARAEARATPPSRRRRRRRRPPPAAARRRAGAAAPDDAADAPAPSPQAAPRRRARTRRRRKPAPKPAARAAEQRRRRSARPRCRRHRDRGRQGRRRRHRREPRQVRLPGLAALPRARLPGRSRTASTEATRSSRSRPTFADPDLEFRPPPGRRPMSPTPPPPPHAAGELVPIADRLRYMQAFRFLLVARRRRSPRASRATSLDRDAARSWSP